MKSLSGQNVQDWAGNLNWGGGVYFEHETSSAQNDDDTSGTVSAEPVVTGENCPENLSRDLSAKSLSW